MAHTKHKAAIQKLTKEQEDCVWRVGPYCYHAGAKPSQTCENVNCGRADCPKCCDKL